MIILLVPIIFTLVGILAYALSSNAVVKEVARAMFWTGFLVVQLELASRTMRLL